MYIYAIVCEASGCYQTASSAIILQLRFHPFLPHTTDDAHVFNSSKLQLLHHKVFRQIRDHMAMQAHTSVSHKHPRSALNPDPIPPKPPPAYVSIYFDRASGTGVMQHNGVTIPAAVCQKSDTLLGLLNMQHSFTIELPVAASHFTSWLLFASALEASDETTIVCFNLTFTSWVLKARIPAHVSCTSAEDMSICPTWA